MTEENDASGDAVLTTDANVDMPDPPQRWWDVFSLDLRSLALMRVALAAVLIADLIDRGRSLVPFYTDEGIHPGVAAAERIGIDGLLSPHLLASGSAGAMAAVFIVHGLAAALLLIGWRSRSATLVCWFLLRSLLHHNPGLVTAGDRTMQVVLFWSIFLPLGARWSVDSAMSTSRRSADRYVSMASAALLLQIGFIYVFSVAEKLQNPVWRAGDALAFSLDLDQYARLFGFWLGDLSPELLVLATYATLAIEAIGPFLVILPGRRRDLARIVAISLFVGLHGGIALCMNLGIFPAISIAVWSCVVPALVWDRLAARWRTPSRLGLRIYYDGECGFCRRTALLLRTFFLLPETQVEPAQGDATLHEELTRLNSWIVIDGDGRHHHRFEAVVVVLGCSPWARPISWILSWRPIRWIGDRLYHVVAENRHRLGWVTALLRLRPCRNRLPLGVELVVAVLLLMIFVSNVMTVVPHVPMRPLFRKVASVVGMQSWKMFTYTDAADGWFNVVGYTRDGEAIDLLVGEGPPRWTTRPVPTAHYPSFRWRVFLHARGDPLRPERWRSYARWQCRTHHRRHPGADRIVRIEVVFMLKYRNALGLSEHHRETVYEHACDERS